MVIDQLERGQDFESPESGEELRHLLQEHEDSTVRIGRFEILHMESDGVRRPRPYQHELARFEIRLNHDFSEIELYLINKTDQDWPVPASKYLECLRSARPVNDELTDRRVEKLQDLLV